MYKRFYPCTRNNRNLKALWARGYAGVRACADQPICLTVGRKKSILTYKMIWYMSAKLTPALIVLSIITVVQTYNCGECYAN